MKTRDDLYLQLIQGLANCLITKGFCGVPVTEEELMELAESYGWQRENTTGGKVHEVVAIVREWVKKGIVEVREERGKVTSNRTTFVLRDPNSLNADNADNAERKVMETKETKDSRVSRVCGTLRHHIVKVLVEKGLTCGPGYGAGVVDGNFLYEDIKRAAPRYTEWYDVSLQELFDETSKILKDLHEKEIVWTAPASKGEEFSEGAVEIRDLHKLAKEARTGILLVDNTIKFITPDGEAMTQTVESAVVTGTPYIEDMIEEFASKLEKIAPTLSKELTKQAEAAIQPAERCPEANSEDLWKLIKGSSLWEEHTPGERTCKFCGSIHPEDFMNFLAQVQDIEGTRVWVNHLQTKVYIQFLGQAVKSLYVGHLPSPLIEYKTIIQALEATRKADADIKKKLKEAMRRRIEREAN